MNEKDVNTFAFDAKNIVNRIEKLENGPEKRSLVKELNEKVTSTFHKFLVFGTLLLMLAGLINLAYDLGHEPPSMVFLVMQYFMAILLFHVAVYYLIVLVAESLVWLSVHAKRRKRNDK